VETPLPGSPALKGGILAGDVIVQVNGQATADFPAGQEVATATARIQGQPGETVTLGVRHPASGAFERIQLVREVIRFTSVTGDRLKADLTWDFMLDDAKRIGYIHLAYVGRQSPEDMRAALTELKSRGLRALVLDLRNNPGGSLDESVAIADLFVESGILLTVKGRTGEARVYTAEPEGTFSGFPIAVLVNRNTASGGEIIAAGLQDHQRAIVVGERTYGQALVKNLFSLEGGKSALKLPTAAYYRPNGKNMHRYPDAVESDDWGVRPNEHYEVVGSAEEPEQFGKDRLRRSVLNGRAPEGAGFEDRVLRKALEYLEAPSGKPSSDR